MKKFRVVMIDGSDRDESELFDSFEEAEDELNIWREGLTAGHDIIALRPYEDDVDIDPDSVSFEIEEIDEDGEVVETTEM